MTVSDRERRMLSFLGVSVILYAIFWLVTESMSPSPAGKVVGAIDSVQGAETRLTNLRLRASAVPAREGILKQVSRELSTREKGLIKGDTAPQAQAQLLQVLREVARNQNPPLQINQVELGAAQPYGDSYGQVSVSITVECRIDQLVNYLAYLSTQPELISTEQVRFSNSNPKLKTNQVRLTVAGLVSRKLIPTKKGATAF